MSEIPFNRPYQTGAEIRNIKLAHKLGQLAGDGRFTRSCHEWLESHFGCSKALLTHSCTAALEMCAILADIQPGDEVIMPSYTFVSTANAFVLRGAIPIFVDIRKDTLNLDESLVEEAISSRTKAIVAVHYAGVACEMDALKEICVRHQLLLIEDAAQALMSSYKGKPVGSIGDLAAISFHETKNIISGEGGAIIINNSIFSNRAEIIREKGTNRSQFFRGEIDKYTWVDIGSSYLPGELIAAFLYAQLDEAARITRDRLNIWNSYHHFFKPYESRGLLRRPIITENCSHNGHLYYLLLENSELRDQFIAALKVIGVKAVFHYVPLHSSPAGIKYARSSGSLKVTEDLASRLVRLPLWLGLNITSVQDSIRQALDSLDS
jgi:dTDP-4-amino-4,6-dideoxygalactose transaminase